MDKTILSPEESISLITKTIQDAKTKFKQNGHIFIMWGTLMLIVNLSQFVLLQMEYHQIHWYPNFLYPFGAIYTFVYFWKKRTKEHIPSTIIGNILGTTGWVMGMNLMILGFLFSNQIGQALAPIFLIFLALFIIIAGVSIQFKPMIVGGLLLNVIGLSAFYVTWNFHPLIMATGAIVGIIIPAVWLNKERNKDHV